MVRVDLDKRGYFSKYFSNFSIKEELADYVIPVENVGPILNDSDPFDEPRSKSRPGSARIETFSENSSDSRL